MGEASADLDPSNILAKAYTAAGLVRADIANWQVAGLIVRDAQQQMEDQIASGEMSRDDDDIPLVLYHTAEVITVAGQYSEAALLLERAIELKPDFTAARIDLAYIMFNVEQQNITAIRLLEQALEEKPNDAVLLDTLAQFNIIGTGDYAAAEEYARRAVEQNPDMLRAHARLAHAYFKNFNYPSAIEELRIATAGYGEPDTTTSFYFALLGLALYFQDTANCAEAEPILQAAFEASVENSPGWLNAQEGLRLCREAGFASP
jgi:tetratricopeptide (TPR) repeat protein